MKVLLCVLLGVGGLEGPEGVGPLLGTPYQHEQLETGLHSSHTRRFPVLEEFLTQTAETLHKEYWPSDNITTWSDEACPVFLVTGDLVVCGNLFVRGKLTVLTAVNTSVFEDVLDEGDKITTQKLSRFAAARCTKTVPVRLTPGVPAGCGTRGNLVLPRAGLLVSGTLTVLGSAVTGSMTVDGAASVAMGVATFLNLHGAAPSTKPGPPQARAIRRSARRLERPTPFTSHLPHLPHAVWPSAAEHFDSICHQHGDKIPDALFLPKGMLYLRNHASLFTFGKTVTKIAGLDRSSMWLSRCGGVATADHDGQAGDIILMSASTFLVTGEHSKVQVGNLIASEGSLVSVQGSLKSRDLIKVTLGSAATVSHNCEAFDVAIADSSTLSVTKNLHVDDLAMLSGGRLLVGANFDALSMEAYDEGEVFVKKDLTIGEYLVADEGAKIEVREGSCNIGGSCLLANHSSLTLNGPKSTLIIAEDLRAKSGVSIRVPSATIGCSFLLDLYSTARVFETLRVRDVEVIKRPFKQTDSEDQLDPPTCDAGSALMLVQKSELTAAAGLKVGGHNLPNNSSVPTLSIFSNSEVKVGTFIAPQRRHATILKGGSRFYVGRSEPGPEPTLLRPGQLLTLEGGSDMRAIGLDSIDLRSVELMETSQMVMGAGSIVADWVKLQSRSKLDLMNLTPLLIRRGLDVHEDSTCFLNGGVTFGPQFDHMLSSTGSEIAIGGRCGQHENGVVQLRGKIIAQDAGTIVIDATVAAEYQSAEIVAESNSQVDLNCYLDNESEALMTFKKTAESAINVPSSAVPVRPTIYRLKVPPSDSGSLKAFTNGTMHRAGAEHARRNAFWDVWRRAAVVDLTLEDEASPLRRASQDPVEPSSEPPLRPPPVVRSRRRRDL